MTNTNKLSTTKQKKAETVSLLGEKLKKATSFFITDYKGLTHQQLENLRRELRKVEAELLITKNRLFKVALGKANETLTSPLEDALKLPTAILFSYRDALMAIKTLANFMKLAQLPKVKKGVFEGRVVGTDEFTRLASLPSREILLATLASQLQSPISGLHYALRWNLVKLVVALNNVKEKKTSN